MTERNQSLDLLRGLAVLLVVAVHCSHVATSIFPDLRSMVMQYGELGVQLFFIVSGYTMMLTFGDKVDVAGVCSFYLRRVFRIVPLFWVAILFYLLTTKGEGFQVLGTGRCERRRRPADVPLPAMVERDGVQFRRARRLEHRR